MALAEQDPRGGAGGRSNRADGSEQLDMTRLRAHMKVLSPAPLIERMRAAGEALMRDHPEPE